jgi:hypothetical protein
VTRARSSIWRATLRPVRGSLRVTLARWLLWIAAALPGVGLTREALGRDVARLPYFVDSPDLDLVQLLELARRLQPLLPPLLLGVGVSWLVLQFLTAGAALRLDRARRVRLSLWRACCDGGASAWLPYLRIALLAAALSAIGWLGLARGFDALSHHGELAGWTGRTLVRDLPFARGVLSGLWVSLVGVFAFWLRMGIAAEGHARVRSIARRTLRLMRRRPAAALVSHWIAAVATLGVQAAILLAWRTSTSDAPATSLWLALWTTGLLASAYTWQWRVRAALELWRSEPIGSATAARRLSRPRMPAA